MARGINLLHLSVQSYAEKLVEECKNQGLLIQITDTLRTKDEQDNLYAQGRTKSGNIVTNAKYPQSNHNWGIAFDFCRDDGKGAYNDDDGFFSKVGAVGKSIGLDWGGDWESIVDKPHFEYSGFGTWRALKTKYDTPENFLGTSVPEVSGSTSNLLKNGSRGDAVKELQDKLNGLGYNCGEVDGIFGEKTLAAVKAFQQDNSLVVDGIVGDKTRAALEAEKNAEASPQPIINTEGNELVKEYQEELNAQFNAGLVVDGIFGSKTKAATINVQKGAEGNLTRILQKTLNAKGYNCGEVDGIFGEKTEAAVKAFQEANSLVIDGVAGRNTWKVLLN